MPGPNSKPSAKTKSGATVNGKSKLKHLKLKSGENLYRDSKGRTREDVVLTREFQEHQERVGRLFPKQRTEIEGPVADDIIVSEAEAFHEKLEDQSA